MKVLVVDDSGVMRRIHRNTLEENKVAEGDILEAEDGEAALTIAQSEDIGIFLLDWNMPKINGLEFVKRIRIIDKYKETPIFMITSEAAKYNVVEAVKAGVTNYIIKPIQGNMLWEKIGKYFT